MELNLNDGVSGATAAAAAAAAAAAGDGEGATVAPAAPGHRGHFTQDNAHVGRIQGENRYTW